jgi:nitrogen fixation/metabolism regulation signal transduction histidine kinase
VASLVYPTDHGFDCCHADSGNDQELPFQIKLRRRDEFDDLYQGFNTMIAELASVTSVWSKLATTDPLTG